MTLKPTPVREGLIQDYCTAAEAAEIKNIKPSSLYFALRRGRLTAYSIFGQTVLLRADVEAWKVRRKNAPINNL